MEKEQNTKRCKTIRSFGEMLCPVCKKIFICYNASIWAYKKELLGKRYVFCSYKCLRNKVLQTEYEKSQREWKRGMKKYE